MHTRDLLKKLGLTDEQAKIYVTLLKLAQATITELAKATGMHRPAIYHHLPPLLEQGLISQSQKGRRRIFVAESPEHLTDVVKRFGEELQTALPDLLSTYRTHQTQPVIRYFQGAKGIRSAYEDLLRTVKKGDVVYRYESPLDRKRYAKYQPREYAERILQGREIEWMIITNDATRKTKRLERLYKTVPLGEHEFRYDISEFIYHNKVSFIDYKNEVASIIESHEFADFQRKIFRLLFDRLPN